jgi:thiamine kinase-like enzyme
MTAHVEQIIRQVPNWGEADDIHIKPLEGLTNTNYLVTVNGERFALRVSGPNAARLGIDRAAEIDALSAAAQVGIAPDLVHSQLPEGHLVTRYIPGRHLPLEEYRTPENLQRIVDTLKRLHRLPLPRASFSPFQRVELFSIQAREMGVSFPADFETFQAKMKSVRQQQAADTTPWQFFCHNDLFCVNVLDDEQIWFIDWEFAGTGDIYFDLATLTYAYDSPDTLPPDLQEYLLVSYFGAVNGQIWRRLKGMQYMLMFFSAMWGLLQQGMQNAGLVREVEGFSFSGYAEETFEAMRSTL